MANEVQEPAEMRLGRLTDSFNQIDKRLSGIERRLAWLLDIVITSLVLRAIAQLT